MFLIHSRAKAVSAIAAREAARYARPESTLNGVMVKEMETTIEISATDGKRAIVVNQRKRSMEDFPMIPGFAPVNSGKSALIPADEFGKIFSKIPKKSTRREILEQAIVAPCADGVSVETASTDLETENCKRIKCLEGNYPVIEDVIPKQNPVFTINFNPDLLSELLDAISRMSRENAKVVTFDFYGPDSPAKITAETPDGDPITAVIMPMPRG